ncbi:hypothetical protein AJ79_09895 [Helicocarpus griseus UAMH5409]|uniref:Uncharacterized protein n=1 Tax=Helicocarpus griseus UAMH5409 TaxID=1447875 RepID=A0A2B7WGK8_9EURO|nr:hypothetical protein AJ79_09895 [Helicocarpus griseus UAMH5409]
MAVAVECAFLDALSFNAIQTFEEQEKEVDKATLMSIADIFVRHNMYKKLGAGLLHCHDTLQDGTVMFHEVQSPETDICIPKALSSIDMDKIAANSWFLNQNGLFQAFEYDASGEATLINAAFASDLTKFLKVHSLENGSQLSRTLQTEKTSLSSRILADAAPSVSLFASSLNKRLRRANLSSLNGASMSMNIMLLNAKGITSVPL